MLHSKDMTIFVKQINFPEFYWPTGKNPDSNKVERIVLMGKGLTLSY